MQMCAWSDSFECTFTCAPEPSTTGSLGGGAPGSPPGTSPSRASSSSRTPSGKLPAIPTLDVLEEGLARRTTDRLLPPDDVPPEGRVPVDELVEDAGDIVARRIEVHVHLLDDHALLALDLVGVELRVPEHVDEHVERMLPMLGGALDVVPRVLLAGEGVELGADPVELEPDLLRCGTPLRALEEHVLGEVRDAARLGRLVAGARGEHDEAGHRLHLWHRRSQETHAVPERLALEDGHTVTPSSRSRHSSGSSRDSLSE